MSYDEIALKGGRRGYYEAALVQNLAKQLGLGEGRDKVWRSQGRIRIDLGETDDPREAIAAVQRTFGVVGTSVIHPIERTDTVEGDFERAVAKGVELLRGAMGGAPSTFKVNTRRRDKSYGVLSTAISQRVGGLIHDELGPEGLEVDVHEPDHVLTLEVEARRLYLALGDEPGPRGMPTGTAGRGLVLLSGGIDSPVAAWYAFKRGLHADAVHFHAPPGTGPKAKEKVATLARQLSRWTPKILYLYYVKTTAIQDAIAQGAPERMRVVLLRRSFARIGERISKWKGYKCLIGGEALGQVASQTPENLRTLHAAIPETLYLSPLIGMDKVEITHVAERIGTYETSVQPHPDCCSIFAPRSPELAAKIAECVELEATLGLEALELEAAEERETVAFRHGEAIKAKRR